MQSVFIGIGAVAASALPWFLGSVMHVGAGGTAAHEIPVVIRISFRIGALAFLGAVLWTIITTKEYPPERAPEGKFSGIFKAIGEMPQTMKDLAWVQIATWLGLYCMWLYFTVTVARYVFGAPDTQSPAYTQGVEWANICFGMYSVVCFFFSMALPSVAHRLGQKNTHSVCLIAGALGLLSVGAIHRSALLLLSMTGVGIAWASILSMPYAMLSKALPAEKMGFYMGVFNFFIVIPEICVSLGFGWVMNHLLHSNTLYAVVAGGVFMLIAAALTQRVRLRA
jgi:maltose/moltooligosaccharide transporter